MYLKVILLYVIISFFFLLILLGLLLILLLLSNVCVTELLLRIYFTSLCQIAKAKEGLWFWCARYFYSSEYCNKSAVTYKRTVI